METITYEYEGALYVNLTNRCDCACVFCLRNNGHKGSIYADDLWLEHEPSREEALKDLLSRDLSRYTELVFCGFGDRNMDMLRPSSLGCLSRLAMSAHLAAKSRRSCSPILVCAISRPRKRMVTFRRSPPCRNFWPFFSLVLKSFSPMPGDMRISLTSITC